MTAIKWLIGLATIAALVWFARNIDDAGTRTSVVDSPSMQELPPTAIPAIGLNRPLSMAEIRWCMSQNIRLQTIEPKAGTHRAVDRYNEIARDYNRHCNGQAYSRVDAEEATRSIEGTRRQIAAAAIEDIRRLNDEGLTRQTQALLERLGYEPGAVDGVYGAQTKAAIEAFQQNVGSRVDGLLSQELMERLRTARMTLLSRENAETANVAGTTNVARTVHVPGTANVVIHVIEKPQESVADSSDAQAVPDAEVKIFGDRGFHGDQLTNERGTAEFAAVPTGKLDVDVRRNEGRSRVTFQVTEDPDQQIWIALPAAPRAAR